MITSEVREWLKKAENKQISYEDAVSEFLRFSSYLSEEDMDMIKKRLTDAYR